MSLTLARVNEALLGVGLTPRGAFHPRPEDGVPDVGPAQPAMTLVLAGNAGPSMWEAFNVARDPAVTLIDDWSRDVLEPLALSFSAKAVYPFQKPYLPFQRWAQQAEPCQASPLGMFIHPDYGLWHGYRGGLAFVEHFDLPPPDNRPRACDDCTDQPCLDTCPVNAFKTSGYDVPACVRYLASNDGADCMELGCRARR
ncbi:MAG: 4Fe-4S dicluster domain-containing protein, partial [Rhodospirillales bacterium]|nr:4Fe-4S dicluster domain-containing protein [Rhodospirillales bacterium]